MWQWMMAGHYGWWPMGNMMVFGGIFWLAILAFGAYAIFWNVRGAKPSSLDILEARYAKGEIPRDEYLEKKRDIGS